MSTLSDLDMKEGSIRREYQIGIQAKRFLLINDKIISLIEHRKGKIYKLCCNIEDQTMDYFSNDSLVTYSDIVLKNDKLIDLDAEGSYWIGSLLEKKIYGFGSLFNGDNNLVYCGFMKNRQKILYGEEYYTDCRQVRYIGCYVDDLPFGFGKLFDKNGTVIYEGDWVLGKPVGSLVTIPNSSSDDRAIHKQVCELVIGHKCLNMFESLELKEYHCLKKLVIGDFSFRNVSHFQLYDCNELEYLSVGKKSFCMVKEVVSFNSSFRIANCSQLREVIFDSHSCTNFFGSFVLESICMKS